MVECKPDGVTVTVTGSQDEPWIKIRVPSGKELSFAVEPGTIGGDVATELRNLNAPGRNVAPFTLRDSTRH
jgi:hypothetical protein